MYLRKSDPTWPVGKYRIIRMQNRIDTTYDTIGAVGHDIGRYDQILRLLATEINEITDRIGISMDR